VVGVITLPHELFPRVELLADGYGPECLPLVIAE
jgi:hypothetical protein